MTRIPKTRRPVKRRDDLRWHEGVVRPVRRDHNGIRQIDDPFDFGDAPDDGDRADERFGATDYEECE
jgi:hypothetical protein